MISSSTSDSDNSLHSLYFTSYHGLINYPQKIPASGGLDTQASEWVHLDSLPYPRLRKKWQWYVLTMLRQTVKTPEITRLGALGYTRYHNGFVTNVHKGDVPSR